MGAERTTRLQIDISQRAKRNLRIFAGAAGVSMSEALDQLLTRDVIEIAKRRFNIVLASDGENGNA